MTSEFQYAGFAETSTWEPVWTSSEANSSYPNGAKYVENTLKFHCKPLNKG